ncbi:MAG: hypothetical protein AAGD07_18160 [Planctomycetota bacterium]
MRLAKRVVLGHSPEEGRDVRKPRRGYVSVMMAVVLLMGISASMAMVTREASHWNRFHHETTETRMLDDAILSVERYYRDTEPPDSAAIQLPVTNDEGQRVAVIELKSRLVTGEKCEVEAELIRNGRSIAIKSKTLSLNQQGES